MVAVEALQDPFMHMYSMDIDEENFKPMDVSNLNRYEFSVAICSICNSALNEICKQTAEYVNKLFAG